MATTPRKTTPYPKCTDSPTTAPTTVTPIPLTPAQRRTIKRALAHLESHLNSGDVLSSPTRVRQYCQLHIAREPDEHFACLFLTTQHHLITFERLFRGGIDGAAVYPRVIVRRCLELNAAAVILVHNHPSGVCEPSAADRRITERLQGALQLVDVRVLDHLIVSASSTTSFAELGLI